MSRGRAPARRAPARTTGRRAKPRRRAPAPPDDVAPRGEFALIDRLVRGLPTGSGVVVGPGDDAAVLRPRAGRDLVATTDAFVAGVHFVPARLTAEEVGARLAAANLSDLAAMAAEPRWALLSLGLGDENADWAVGVQRGLARALDAHGAALAGGNVSRTSGATWLSLALLGEVERGQAWTRHGARPGDRLAVTGHPGRAGAAVRVGALAPPAFVAEACVPLRDAHVVPESRIAFARALAAAGAVTAAIDVSDGIAGDLAHLCEASGVGVALDENAWPDDPALTVAARMLAFQQRHGRSRAGAARAWKSFRPAPSALAEALRALRFGASDDYELLLAIDPAHVSASAVIARQLGVPLAFVGTCTDAPGVLVLHTRDGRPMPLPGAGWDHLAR